MKYEQAEKESFDEAEKRRLKQEEAVIFYFSLDFGSLYFKMFTCHSKKKCQDAERARREGEKRRKERDREYDRRSRDRDRMREKMRNKYRSKVISIS